MNEPAPLAQPRGGMVFDIHWVRHFLGYHHPCDAALWNAKRHSLKELCDHFDFHSRQRG